MTRIRLKLADDLTVSCRGRSLALSFLLTLSLCVWMQSAVVMDKVAGNPVY